MDKINRIRLLFYTGISVLTSFFLLSGNICPSIEQILFHKLYYDDNRLIFSGNEAEKGRISRSGPAVLESRILSLTYPETIQVGDSDQIQLIFDMDDKQQIKPTLSVILENPFDITNSHSDIYQQYHVLAEARLEMPGMDVRPIPMVSEPLLPGQKVTFYWSVLSNKNGSFDGTVWFYLRYISKLTGVESHLALYAKNINIKSSSFLGTNTRTIRWLGVIGLVISFFLMLPSISQNKNHNSN